MKALRLGAAAVALAILATAACDRSSTPETPSSDTLRGIEDSSPPMLRPGGPRAAIASPPCTLGVLDTVQWKLSVTPSSIARTTTANRVRTLSSGTAYAIRRWVRKDGSVACVDTLPFQVGQPAPPPVDSPPPPVVDTSTPPVIDTTPAPVAYALTRRGPDTLRLGIDSALLTATPSTVSHTWALNPLYRSGSPIDFIEGTASPNNREKWVHGIRLGAGYAVLTTGGVRRDSVRFVVIAAPTPPADSTPAPPDTAPTPPADSTPTPPDTSAPDTGTGPRPPPSAVAELPRVILTPPMPAVVRTLRVSSAAALQAAVDSARSGDVIALPAGATIAAPTLRAGKTPYVVITTDGFSYTPGQRIVEGDSTRMATLSATRVPAGLTCDDGASGYILRGIRIIAPVTLNRIVECGRNDLTTLAQAPSDVWMQGVIVRPASSAVSATRAATWNCGRCGIVDSKLVGYVKGFDSQAISVISGPGPMYFANNDLWGAGENVLFGGGDPKVQGLTPADIVFLWNRFYKDRSWYGGVFTVKNLFELKNARRVLIEGNIFDGSWVDGQTGFAIVLKSANQSGGCPWCTTQDVTFRWNRIINAAQCFSLQGISGTNPVVFTTRLAIEHNSCVANGPTYTVGVAKLVQLTGSGWSDYLLQRNTMTFFSGPTGGASWLAPESKGTNLQVLDNVVSDGQYGIKGSGASEGIPSLTAYVTNYSVTGNAIIGSGNLAIYPPGNLFVSSLAAAPAGTGVDAATLAAKTATAGSVPLAVPRGLAPRTRGRVERWIVAGDSAYVPLGSRSSWRSTRASVATVGITADSGFAAIVGRQPGAATLLSSAGDTVAVRVLSPSSAP